MSLVKNRRRNMTEDESGDGALSRQVGTKKHIFYKGHKKLFWKKVFLHNIYVLKA